MSVNNQIVKPNYVHVRASLRQNSIDNDDINSIIEM